MWRNTVPFRGLRMSDIDYVCVRVSASELWRTCSFTWALQRLDKQSNYCSLTMIG